MGVDWGRDDGEYEYDDLDRPPDRRKRRQGADWDDRDWAPTDEPMGPDADRDRGPPPQRPGYDEEQYRQEYTDRARSHHYRGGPMDEDAREKRLFQEAQWETRGQPRRAPAPQARDHRSSSGRWDQDVYERHKPPERNMAANEFYRMQDAEWREKQYEDPYRRKKKRPSAAGKWYRTEGEKSRMARRQAHEPYVEKEKIILERHNYPVGIKVIAALQIIGGLIGLVFVAYDLIQISYAARMASSYGYEIPASIMTIVIADMLIRAILFLVIVIAGFKLMRGTYFGYIVTIWSPWLIMIYNIVSVVVIIYLILGVIFIPFTFGMCLIVPITYALVIYFYLKRYDTLFK